MLTPADLVENLKLDGTFDELRKLILNGFQETLEFKELSKEIHWFLEQNRFKIECCDLENVVEKAKLQQELTEIFQSTSVIEKLKKTLKSSQYLSNESFTQNLHQLIKSRILQLISHKEERENKKTVNTKEDENKFDNQTDTMAQLKHRHDTESNPFSINSNEAIIVDKQIGSNQQSFQDMENSKDRLAEEEGPFTFSKKIQRRTSPKNPNNQNFNNIHDSIKDENQNNQEKDPQNKLELGTRHGNDDKATEVLLIKKDVNESNMKIVQELNSTVKDDRTTQEMTDEKPKDFTATSSKRKRKILREEGHESHLTKRSSSRVNPGLLITESREKDDIAKIIENEPSGAVLFLENKIGKAMVMKKASLRNSQFMLVEIVSVNYHNMTASVVEALKKKSKKITVGLDVIFDYHEATKNQKLENGDQVIHLNVENDKVASFQHATFTRSYQMGKEERMLKEIYLNWRVNII